MLKPLGEISEISNSLNLQDDSPTIMFVPHVDKPSDEDIPPFYVGLNIHNSILHNAMLDSGVSHNLMPMIIMDKLGLEVTRPYKDLFSFDSSKVNFLGMIKYLVISLAQIPTKTLIMDVVVADIPPKFAMFLSRMLLSRSWEAKPKS